jgi:LacI family transcriptional regulator
MAVRMQDIATDLKLSKMTISKVLRGQMDVSEKTKARVMQRVKELNYRPNISARSLKTGRTLNVGLIVPSLSDSQYNLIARSFVQHLRPASYSVSLSSAEHDPELERREIEQQLSWQVDALVLASVQTPKDLVQLEKSGIPLIHLHGVSGHFKSNSIAPNEEEIGYLAGSHLARIGCRRIASVRVPSGPSSALRFKGFKAALSEARLRFFPELNTVPQAIGENDYDRGVRVGRLLISGQIKPDGIICDTDLTAVGVMDVVSASGLEIPKEIAVIGCGNDLRLCEMRIPLSSVDLSSTEIGKRAAQLALKLMSQAKAGKVKSITVSPTLVIRASTARLR